MAFRFLTIAPAAVLAGAAAFTATAPANAAVFTNGSFEADAVGFTGVPTGFSRQAGVSTEIVSTNATDGSQAITVSGTTDNSGFYQAVRQELRGFAPELDELIVGQEYRILGDVTFLGNGLGNAYLRFDEYEDLPNNDFGNGMGYSVRADASNPVLTLDEAFTYRGGAIDLSLQIDSYAGVGEAPVFVSATFDNIRIVPEPASAAVLGLLGVAGLRRRR